MERICPYCGQAITSDELAKKIKEAERIRLEEVQERQRQEFEAEFEKREAKLKDDLASGFDRERQDLIGKLSRLSEQLAKAGESAASERQKLAKEFENKIAETSRRAVEEARETVKRETEEERLRLEKRLTSMASSLDTAQADLKEKVDEFHRREKEFAKEVGLIEEKARDEATARAREESANELKKKDIEVERLKLESEQERLRLHKQVEDLNRRLEKKTAEELGRVPEEELEKLLREQFSDDRILHVGPGKAGGDLVQTVIASGEEAGKVVYEVKNTLHWNNDFIEQAKKHRTTYNTPYVILVTRAFPAGEKDFSERDGILIVSSDKAAIVARILRQAIVDIHREKAAGSEVHSKASELYEYLRSPEFQEQLRAIFECIEELRRLQSQEQRFHTKHWDNQEKEHRELLTHTSGIEGKINSIIEGRLIHIPVPKKSSKDKETGSESTT